MKVCKISEFLLQRAVSSLLHDGNHHVTCFLLFNMRHLWLKIVFGAFQVLEACMNNCGQRFRSEVAKFRFLNELIKVLTPKVIILERFTTFIHELLKYVHMVVDVVSCRIHFYAYLNVALVRGGWRRLTRVWRTSGLHGVS